MQNNYDKNINKLYALKVFWMFLVLMPVIIPFFQELGLNMQQIYTLQAVYAGGMFLLELPLGYFSDLAGRKSALFLAAILNPFGYIVIFLWPSFEGIVVAEIILAISGCLLSGTDVSLLYDSLISTKSKKTAKIVLSKMTAYTLYSEAIAGVLGGWLYVVNKLYPLYATIAMSLIPPIIVLSLIEPERKVLSKKKHRENLKYIFDSIFNKSQMLNLLILNGAFYGLVTLVAMWSFQKYWQDIGIELEYFGLMWATTFLVTGLFSQWAVAIEKLIGGVGIVLLMAFLPMIAFVGMAFTDSKWGALYCFLFPVVRAICLVVISDGLNQRVPAEIRATVNSVISMVTRFAFMLAGPIVGLMLDERGGSQTYMILSGVTLIVFIILVLPLLNQRKNYIK